MRMMLILILVASAFVTSVFLPSAAWAEAAVYQLVKDKSTLRFFAIQNNAPVEGAFTDFSADIRFNPDKPEEGSIRVEVATASVTTAYDEVAKNLLSPQWLSVQAFPKAVFRSTNITRMPNSDNYYADGSLTLRDKTVPVVLNFQLKMVDGHSAVAKGYITLRRADYGVGQGEWAKDDVVKNEVRVEFRVVAEKQ